MTLDLFSETTGESTTVKTAKKVKTKVVPGTEAPFSAETLAQSLVHPFPRYGLALALAFYSSGVPLAELSEDQLREMLAQAVESGLNAFRMETFSDPTHEDILTFQSVSIDRLRVESELVQSKGLASKGKYLYPSVITSDGGAKGTFEETSKIIVALREPEVPLTKQQDMKRSFAPMMGEINNGKTDKQNQKGTLFEAACCAVASVAYQKPAALSEGRNTGIFPDLDVPHLTEFVKVFRKLQASGQSLMQGKPAKKNGKPELRRPALHDGNYPDAPREAAFGAIGLLASMGYWAIRADDTTRKETVAVLDALSEIPLYIISYDGVRQATFSHFVVGLAKAGKLRGILNDFYRDTRTYAEYDAPFLKQSAPAVRHLFFAFGRFLQRFDRPSFRDFLSTRAEYPPSTDLLLEVYFMEQTKLSRPIVESARALGQWINRTAYFVAEEDTDKNASDRTKAVRKAKAKVLVEFESAVMSAENAADMLHRVSTRAGRLLQADAPAAATAYFDAAAADEIPFQTAQHLLIAYLRLRAVKTPDLEPQNIVNTDNDTDDVEETTTEDSKE